MRQCQRCFLHLPIDNVNAYNKAAKDAEIGSVMNKARETIWTQQDQRRVNNMPKHESVFKQIEDYAEYNATVDPLLKEAREDREEIKRLKARIQELEDELNELRSLENDKSR